MKFEILEQPSFSVIALSREFNMKTSTAEIPKFWSEYFASGHGEIACGQYGICYDGHEDGTFRYAIGNRCTPEKSPDDSMVYHIFNRSDSSEIPEGFELLTIPEGTWAKFECIGPLPQSIQSFWPRIYNEWLPGSGYEKVPGFDLEEYSKCESPGDAQKPDYKSYIWVRVQKAKA